MASLLSLPTELLLAILAPLVPSPIRTDQTGPISQDHHEKLMTLASARQTCRRLHDISTPLFFRNVVVLTGPQLVSLTTSLLRNPSLRSNVRSFSSLLRLDKWIHNIVVANHFSALAAHVDEFQLDDASKEALLRTKLADHSPPATLQDTLSSLQKGVALVVLLCQRIEDFLIQVPVKIGGHLSYFDGEVPELNAAIAGATASSPDTTDFRCLNSVRIHRQQPNAGLEYAGIRDPLCLPGLERSANLKCLEIYNYQGADTSVGSRNGGLSDSADPEGEVTGSNNPTTFSQVESLSLPRARAPPSRVSDLLQQFTSLQHLTWTFRPSNWELDQIPKEDSASLDGALGDVKETLRSLHIESLPPLPAQRGMSNITVDAPPTLGELGQFTNLTELKIDTATLLGYSTAADDEHENAPSLASRLPPNLTHLELTESLPTSGTPGEDKDRAAAQDQWLSRVLDQFAQDCATSLPRLQQFTFKGLPPREGCGIVAVGVRSPEEISKLDAALRDSGVELSWEWLPTTEQPELRK
ncbi:hypothetical protein BX600DRAFT_33027 [Xylariales sp. PMI_506]|nr:hypothetical protein BX600DRAFT_33027 [Xylariales sp. PMI_506]